MVPHVSFQRFISLSTVLLQVFLGLPLFRLPSGVQCKAILDIWSGSLLKVWPIHFQRLFNRITSMLSCLWMKLYSYENFDVKKQSICFMVAVIKKTSRNVIVISKTLVKKISGNRDRKLPHRTSAVARGRGRGAGNSDDYQVLPSQCQPLPDSLTSVNLTTISICIRLATM